MLLWNSRLIAVSFSEFIKSSVNSEISFSIIPPPIVPKTSEFSAIAILKPCRPGEEFEESATISIAIFLSAFNSAKMKFQKLSATIN